MADLRHPQYDLDSALAVARKITERGAGASLTIHELASFLGYSGARNGAYLNRLAAARLFGFIEGGGDSVRATERAEQIIHPDYPVTEERARLEAFHAVPLYDAFFTAFGRRDLPDDQGMLNALIGRYKVPVKEARGVLTRLLASAEQAGLFKVGGPSRMIEPTIAPAEPQTVTVIEETRPLPSMPDPGSRRFPKIIDGALDLMPAGPPWDEAEYQEWLAFFDQACRVYYRITRSRAAVSTMILPT